MLCVGFLKVNKKLSHFILLCQSEGHLSEGDADNRDAENEAVEDVGEPYPDAANEEPQDIRFK